MPLSDTFGRSPVSWGATCNYDHRYWSHETGTCKQWSPTERYQPQQIVVHWGGGRYAYNIGNPEEAERLLRGWDRYHVGKGWRALAYNFVLGGGAVWRGRGNHPNGAHKNSGKWGPITRAICFQVTHGETPRQRDRHNFARIVLEEPLPVTWHDALSPEQDTQCAGPWLQQWVRDKRWVQDFGTWKEGNYGPAVVSIRRRLKDLGYRAGITRRRRYTRRVTKSVKDYQAAQRLPPTGIVDPDTYRALTNLAH